MDMRVSRVFQAAMLAGVANVAMVSPAMAQDQAVSFNIPAQQLSTALRQFASLTNTDLLYSPSLVANRRSQAVNGTMTPKAALQRMLDGTGLTYVETSPNVLTLRSTSTAVATNASYAQAVPQRTGDGQTAPLTGTVTNPETGSPLPGATVTIVGTDLRTIADDRGQYNFPAVPQGVQTVRVEYLGSQASTMTVTVAPGTRNVADVAFGSDEDADIVVLGYRSAIQKALNQQKNADNNATVVSSDLLGGFPAETVSEALRRVPGVAFGRDDDTGEGSRITVRGFSSEAINVQLNGLDLQGTGFERTIDLSGFLTDNISQITIQKSLLPSHESTGSGGLVEIETKSGLDYGDFSFNFNIEGERNLADSFGDEFQVGGTIAKKLTPNFGIAATVQYRKTNRLNYDARVLDTIPPVLPAGFTSILFVPANRDFPFDPGVDQQLIQSVTYNRNERSEESLVGSINLAWDIGTHTRLRLDLQRNINDSVGTSTGAAVGFLTSSLDMPIPELGGEVRRRTTLRALRPSILYDSRNSKLTSDTISLRGDTLVGRFNLKYKVGYSRAVSKGDNSSITLLGDTATNILDLIDAGTIVTNPDDDPAMTPRVVNGGFTFAQNGLPVPSLSDAGIQQLLTDANYGVFSAVLNPINSPSEAIIGELKARYETPLSFLDYIEVGGKYDSTERRTIGSFTNPFNVTSQRYLRIFGRDTDLATIGNGLLSLEDLGVIGANGFSLPFVTPSSANTIFTRLGQLTQDDPTTAFNEERFNFTDFTTLDPIVDGTGGLTPTNTTEDNIAAYFEGKVELGRFSLVGGVRYEREKRNGVTLSSPSVRLDEPGFRFEPRETFVQAGLVRFNDTGGTVDTWTPSLLATYRPTEEIVARFGYFRSTVNPDFRLLNRSTTYSVDLRPAFARVTILEANPNLKPSTTDNYDFDLAYYFNDTPGLIRAGFFYKSVSNNFTNVAFTPLDNQDVRQRFLDEFAPFATTRPDLLALPANAELLVNRPENGEGGNIWGIEMEVIRRLNFLPGFLSDFGILANATYTNGDFPTLVSARDDNGDVIQLSLDRPLRDQARWVYNLSLDYERDGFQGRVIYTRQSATVETFDEFNLNTVVPAYSTLDARLSYSFERFGSLFTIFLEGDNLLNDAKDADIRTTTSSQFGTGSVAFNFPQRFQFTGGRTITLGLRGRF